MNELDTLIIRGSAQLPLWTLFASLRAAGYSIKATGPGEVTAVPPATKQPAPRVEPMEAA